MTNLARRPRTTTLVLAACAVAVWCLGIALHGWCERTEARAVRAQKMAWELHRAAVPLAQARRQGATIPRLSRAEAGSWAYWETVARASGVPMASVQITPAFTATERAGIVLLETRVALDAVSLEQLLTFIYNARAGHVPLRFASVDAAGAGRDDWDATLAAYLYFEEAGADAIPRPR